MRIRRGFYSFGSWDSGWRVIEYILGSDCLEGLFAIKIRAGEPALGLPAGNVQCVWQKILQTVNSWCK